MIYKKNRLTIDGINIDFLAKKFNTPTYCYSAKRLRKNILNFKKQFSKFNPLVIGVFLQWVEPPCMFRC